MREWRYGMAAVAALALSALSGCGSVSEREDDVQAAVTRFEQALAQQAPARLCAALAPGARQEVEQSAKRPCSQAIGLEELMVGGRVRTVDVYGQQARVVLHNDTLFLSRFPQGWLVIAVGCRQRPAQPYQCQVKSG
ncbi:hypothetical protein ACIBVL_40095 [Streptomyces sp. NPDC049687]|uniref:hypothetical protein n=1 Tax=Streptomyces sp. NPDC049687 TaxID=3365596 RepID=UPI003797FC93